MNRFKNGETILFAQKRFSRKKITKTKTNNLIEVQRPENLRGYNAYDKNNQLKEK